MELIGSTDMVDSSLLITIEDQNGEKEEAIIVSVQDSYKCWLNYCQHITDVKLQKGEEIPRRDDEVVCANHGAMFRLDDGYCTHGPCEGSYLTSVDISINRDQIYLNDDKYSFRNIGGIDDDTGIPDSTTGESDFT